MSPEHRFTVAEGWIELGEFREAGEELSQLPDKFKSSLDFVQLWIRVYAGLKDWPRVEVLSDSILAMHSDNEFALFHNAEALHRQRKSSDAILLIGQTNYGRNTAFGLYNLARYLCANGQPSDALTSLGFAFDRDKSLRLRKDAVLACIMGGGKVVENFPDVIFLKFRHWGFFEVHARLCDAGKFWIIRLLPRQFGMTRRKVEAVLDKLLLLIPPHRNKGAYDCRALKKVEPIVLKPGWKPHFAILAYGGE
jgi:hypothetical protein